LAADDNETKKNTAGFVTNKKGTLNLEKVRTIREGDHGNQCLQGGGIRIFERKKKKKLVNTAYKPKINNNKERIKKPAEEGNYKRGVAKYEGSTWGICTGKLQRVLCQATKGNESCKSCTRNARYVRVEGSAAGEVDWIVIQRGAMGMMFHKGGVLAGGLALQNITIETKSGIALSLYKKIYTF